MKRKPRKIRLMGVVDSEMFENFCDKLDELLAVNATKPIEIEITSPGGDEDIAFAFFGRMQESTAPFIIKAYGQVGSAAILIYAAGDVRLTDAATTFMVHESAMEFDGETHVVRRELERLENAENAFYSRVAACTNVSLAGWKALSEETTYFSAEQAVEYGLAHKIVGLSPNRKPYNTQKMESK